MAGASADPALRASVTFTCGQCGASLDLVGVRTATCPYCASPSFVERPPTAGQPRPALVVAFTGDAGFARRALARWLGSRSWFADARLRRARVEDLRGVYVPAYLYSAVADTEYTASIGEHYTETETYEATDPHGERKTATREVTRTEYRPLAGRHLGYISDLVVSASHGLADAELAAIGPFELAHLRRYAPTLVTGWITEEFARSPEACQRACRGEAIDEIGLRLRRFLPGDSHNDLAWRTSVHRESLDPILVPVWLLAARYRDDRPPLRVVINGQTGAIAGKVPLTAWKLAVAVVAVVAVVAAVALAVSRGGAPG
jgi:DNA-directed RNA polymerase subunit RPC12/RpoP